MAASDILGREVATAAAAIANARAGRRGAPAVSNILDVLPEMILDDVVADARAVLAALAELPPEPRPRGDDRPARLLADAAVLRLSERAETVVILVRRTGGFADGAVSAVGGESALLHHQPADGLLRTVAAVLREAPGVRPSPDHTEPTP